MEKAYQYSFETIWQVKAPLQKVWKAIYEQEKWPDWWRGVISVETLQEGDETDLGKKVRYTWRSILPYTLTFDMESCNIQEPFILEGIAYGELEGEGKWRFLEENGVTTLQYNWDVNTTKKWMNNLRPVLKPLFKWNHDVVMKRGARGLAKKLNAELVRY
ncbi:SRPBCC family protein [Ferruginibacter lapsinanis]|uniref:SRPBCC family protein n=1 Tax=Ferruginibacter lapsinanis TaxID=563172 RepID=UPI001E62EF06|nr:SRPBCC family protein [Ferruginibacter lapsinanis]UEG50804.1 SRPBCC family protein [Ferruginibacter lapsinanis]